jgi:anion transporter
MDPSTRELRLDQIIADYLEADEQGRAPSDEDWLASHPDLADELREFLDDHRMACEATASLIAEAGPVSPGEPRVFADFELLEEIGRGGMGVIYRARQLGLNRVVAVKTIIAGRLASEEEVRRFELEARSAAKLRHPNIVTIHGVGEHEGQSYFSMEHVEGRSLNEVIQDRPLSPRKAARLVRAIADAIGYAHREGVLHRDLKPSNILIEPSGRPKVTDFGLAKLVTEDSELTASGAIIGTPSYMSPEQAAGRVKQVNESSDIYSLGAILYATLTARPPFTGDTAAETITRVLDGEVTPPRVENPEIPEELQIICLRCLEKDPRQRYASARALKEDLERFLEDRPILARPPGYMERAWRWCRRRTPLARLKLAASSWGLILGLLFGLVFWIGPGLGLPLLEPGEPRLNAVAGVAVLMGTWWLTEAIPLAATALLPLVLFPLFDILEPEALAQAYGDDIIFLFLGGFLIALAVEDSGLPRRIALRIVAALGDNPRRIVLAFMLATGLLSMWASNSAVTIMMLPIAISLLEEVEQTREPGTKALGAALMLGIAYSASICGTATPIGSPVNIAAVSQAEGIEITFAQWMAIGLPFAVLQLGVTWVLLAYRLFPLDAGHSPEGRAVARRELARLGPMKPVERRALAVFAVTALLWIFRAPDESWGWARLVTGEPGRLTDGTVAMVMAILCFIIPAGTPRRRRLLRWEATVRLPWGVLFLFGGGMALSAGMGEAGLSGFLGHRLAAGLACLSSADAMVSLAAVIVALALYSAWKRRRAEEPAGWRKTLMPHGVMVAALVPLLLSREAAGPLLLVVAGMTLLTEIFTNLATVQLVTNILARAFLKLGLAAGPLVIGATLAASCAFVLPVSTTPNAVVFGSGRVTVKEMARAGIWLNLVAVFVVMLVVSLYIRAAA